jgi:hypothetical protein
MSRGKVVAMIVACCAIGFGVGSAAFGRLDPLRGSTQTTMRSSRVGMPANLRYLALMARHQGAFRPEQASSRVHVLLPPGGNDWKLAVLPTSTKSCYALAQREKMVEGACVSRHVLNRNGVLLYSTGRLDPRSRHWQSIILYGLASPSVRSLRITFPDRSATRIPVPASAFIYDVPQRHLQSPVFPILYVARAHARDVRGGVDLRSLMRSDRTGGNR